MRYMVFINYLLYSSFYYISFLLFISSLNEYAIVVYLFIVCLFQSNTFCHCLIQNKQQVSPRF